MNKSLKGVAIAAAAMITAGLLLAGVGWMAGGNQPIHIDKKGIHVGERGNPQLGGDLEEFSQDLESFESISVDLDCYDVDLAPGDKFAVHGAYLIDEGKPEIGIVNGRLEIKNKRLRMLNIDLDLPGLLFDDNQPNITITYPKDMELKDVVIRCDASDLSFENVTAGKAEFDLDFGNLNLSGITADEITATMDSGSCTMENIKAAGTLSINNNFGKTTLSDAEAKILKVDSDSGDVSLSAVAFEKGEFKLNFGKLTAKEIKSGGLKVESDSGEVNLNGKLTGVTDISSDMGAVRVSPGGPRDHFNYELNADLGSVTIGGDKISGSAASSNPDAENSLKISTDMGEIHVEFD